MTSSVAEPKRSSKALFKANLHQKKAMVSVWWAAVPLTPYSFLNPGETAVSEKYAQQISEMHWKLQHPQLAPINTEGPILLRSVARLRIPQPTDASEVEQTGFASLVTDHSFFNHPDNWLALLQASRQLFAGKALPQDAENAFQEFCRILKHSVLCYRNKLIFHSQVCSDCNGSYFD